ncbi:MAG: type IV secretory system conjugative DNA transfer family protein [Agathobacter sp.]|nr:type IV secretory system conjugative DNA transfer family protein [Agathobacter sp.]
MSDYGKMILAENQEYSLDCYKTQLNNNVLVVGTSGAGKTRSIVTPNLLEATGSYVVSDPKGNLYNKYKDYLESEGYVVKKLDFTNPEDSDGYNFFEYIQSTQDIITTAHMLIYDGNKGNHVDPFWDQAAQLLVQALVAFLIEAQRKDEQHLHNLLKLVTTCCSSGDMDMKDSVIDKMMQDYGRTHPKSYAVSTYNKFRVAASKTLRSILITVNSKLGLFDTPEIEEMTKKDEMDITGIGQRKTAVFVVVSDTDRSMDSLANLFFTQTMNQLCRYADRYCEDNRLPVPVRFILDDFATNCKIAEFPRMISSIRSRGISAMLMIQAESQLASCYGDDGATIISNCDTYVFLGTNDVETAKAVAERADVLMKKILYMTVGTNWIFRRGQEPINGKNFDLEAYLDEKFNRDSEVERVA